MGEHVVQGDPQPGHVGTACLPSSSFAENGKDSGVATLPIMGRNSRLTIGKVRGKGSTFFSVLLFWFWFLTRPT